MSWRFTHTRLTSQGSTLHGPKGDQQQSPLGSPLPFRQHFRFLTKQQQRKIATEIIELLTANVTIFGPSCNKE
jgi:hypothetical protein